MYKLDNLKWLICHKTKPNLNFLCIITHTAWGTDQQTLLKLTKL